MTDAGDAGPHRGAGHADPTGTGVPPDAAVPAGTDVPPGAGLPAGTGTPADAEVPAGTGVPAEAGWSRLDVRMLAVGPAQEVVRFVPVLVIAVFAGGGGNRPWWALGAVGALMAYGVLRWLTTRYRVTADRIELRKGLLFRQHRSVPLDRVRTVDVTAKLLHRVFGLSVLRVGTGRHAQPGKDDELTLDAVSAAESERLRGLLLARSPATTATATTAAAATTAAGGSAAEPLTAGGGATGGGTELSALDWAWLRFAPLTLLGMAAIGALFGAVWQVVGELGVEVDQARGLFDVLAAQPLALAALIVVVGLLVTGSLGALLLYVEAWWGYRLTREPDGTLRVNRGLLTTRSVSLEERRLRGVEVTEPLLLRAGRGARGTAVATGSGGGDRS
ncbi:MAG TPA: PH domain-containing protein, partial [Pseudonocardiaceae bacterium]